jgi:Flp pilus assembly CpaF family ATPase
MARGRASQVCHLGNLRIQGIEPLCRHALPDVVSMQTRQANLEGSGEIPLRRLVTEALRMRPQRLIVGEGRQEECLDLA